MKKRILALFLAGCVAFTTLPMEISASETVVAVETKREIGEVLQEGDYIYTILEDGSVSITKYAGTETDVTIPGEIAGKPVTMIGLEAFKNNGSLVSVTIPDTVIIMDRDIFYGCSALETVELPDSVRSIGLGVFMNCSALTTVELPEHLIELGQEAFKNCTSLSLMTLPSTLEKLGVAAFYNCMNLTKINIPKNLSITDGGPFMASGISEVEFEEGIKTIPVEMFKECDALTSITIPDTVTVIGQDAFYGCDALTNVVMPDGITNIGYEAFIHCKKLADVELPSSLKEIGDFAFYECNALTIDALPSGLVTIGEAVFYNCSHLSDVTLPQTLEYIGPGAFCKCTSLKRINIPKSLKMVDGIAFSYSGITEVEIEEGVTNIPAELFAHCQNLERVEIPYTVTNIGRAAFYGCTVLDEITIPSKTRYYGDDIFTNSPNVVIYGRPGSPANYYADAWEVEFAEYKKPAETVTLEKEELTLKTEETFDLGYTVTPHTFVDDMVWKSSDETIASVSSDGKITAKKAGEATITFTVGELSETCVVTVLQDVTSIQLSDTEVELQKGATYTLKAEVLPEDASNKVLEWKSSDTNVVTVDENGVLTAINNGDAVITVKATDGTEVSVICKVTVPYLITYVLGGGTDNGENPSFYYGDKVVFEDPVKEGFIFDGWYTEASFENRITEVSEGDITVYAKWTEIPSEVIRYTIAFEGIGAEGTMSEIEVELGETIKLPQNTYVKTGYIFKGWNTDEEGNGIALENGAVVSNLADKDGETVYLYAQWEAITYIVVLDGNGAVNAAKEEYKVKYDEHIILYSENGFERPGYTFTGWNTKADGTGTAYEDGAFLENLTTENGKVITFYAQWKKDIYSLAEAEVILPLDDFLYSGNPIVPEVRVMYNLTNLIEGKDYTLNFVNNTNAGTATVTVTGMGSYTGTVTRNFTINKAHIDVTKVTLSKTSYTYNGKTQKPKVTVVVNGRTLVVNTDYTVTYKNNKNIGMATVTITGKGNYTGTVTKQFAIKVKKGTKFTVSKNKYEVTDDASVKFTGTTSTSKTLSIPKTVKYGGKNFKVTAIGTKALKGNKKLTKVTIGSNVTSIGSSAFAGCTKLATVTVGSKVKTIGASVFEGCKKLSKVTLGSAVTTIDAKAFKNCTALKSITIPSKVTTYGKQAFYGCKNLKAITFKSKRIMAAGKDAFKNIYAKATIKVPKSSYKQYKEMLQTTGAGKKIKIVKVK